MVDATNEALDRIEQQPSMGLPRLGVQLGIPELRTWRVQGFALLWFYFEREDRLDVARLPGERLDVVAILTEEL